MDAKELKIDNYVRFAEAGTIFQINEISETGLGVYDDMEEAWIELDQFEPVPINEEWLLKFGFTYIDDDNEFMSLIRGFSFPLINSDKSCDFSKVWLSKDIPTTLREYKYVHELQNLFFALTGTELTIKETINK